MHRSNKKSKNYSSNSQVFGLGLQTKRTLKDFQSAFGPIGRHSNYISRPTGRVI